MNERNKSLIECVLDWTAPVAGTSRTIPGLKLLSSYDSFKQYGPSSENVVRCAWRDALCIVDLDRRPRPCAPRYRLRAAAANAAANAATCVRRCATEIPAMSRFQCGEPKLRAFFSPRYGVCENVVRCAWRGGKHTRAHRNRPLAGSKVWREVTKCARSFPCLWGLRKNWVAVLASCELHFPPLWGLRKLGPLCLVSCEYKFSPVMGSAKRGAAVPC